ncbi:exosortase family protein XrtF [Flavobacterium sp.]|uniref:exosortase family protein XrtF n=1 Tax=Flavobacterium sp. TaxID=239 RepID=UPI0022BF49E0|nr:exosortase family protein XrtF [Flavobacterium sp.]MCZ8228106.1 exosortase family protein XrtF [Flavobacterium sp.]
MKNYWTLYKPFLKFIGTFLLAFILLTFLYQWYLSGYEKNQIDGITRLVASHVEKVLQVFDSNSAVVYDNKTKISILMHQKEVARIIEGCNAISVVILFVSFVMAFAGRITTALLFLIGGSVLIYLLNVIRIAVLSVLLYRFPAYEHLLHGVIFPLFIYGVVFILWFIWVNYFSSYGKKSTSK